LAVLKTYGQPPLSGFLYHLFLFSASMGLAWGAVNMLLSLGDRDYGWYPLWAAFVAVPSVLLLGTAAVIGVNTKRSREGWKTALILHGLTFAALLTLVKTTRWNGW
jgi:hypothetical protein